ncbi:uracil-DNA glycosylase family protein [Floridanema aerugineum]|uniref:Uracil-DNA glycosylase family protein n=1 Tax=Floridaenema aerugineum BLCC-F46 TaxID=3153654 RepID=A0ABV4X716_9CYAN
MKQCPIESVLLKGCTQIQEKKAASMPNITQLLSEIQQEAESASFPIDEPVYLAAGLKPTQPILYAGNLNSQLCFFARDLGKDEVHANQPLIGAAGKLVRSGLYRAMTQEAPTKTTDLQVILERVLLTNTVPYKPPGNKAYSQAVKKRFRPFIERLLVLHWQGNKIITLGNEAFDWFTPYTEKGVLAEFFRRSDRYSATIETTITAKDNAGNLHKKLINLMPLPHPSPLNQKYYSQFPQLLQERLAGIFS